jgi:hypothetical protein
MEHLTKPILSEGRRPRAALTRDEGENGTILVSGVVEEDFDVGEADVPQGPEQIVARQPS